MTVETTLAKADADLRAGRIPVARQRLRGLVGSYPADLTARRRLAEVYRLYGEPAQAGRWTYLDEDRDPAETAAFEARYANPLDRMAALAWRGPEEKAPTETARARLAEVRTAASAHLGRPVRWWNVQAARTREIGTGLLRGRRRNAALLRPHPGRPAPARPGGARRRHRRPMAALTPRPAAPALASP
ncbi:DUF6584 family protein [Kitasatospora sp. NPDC085879]|uniref:DUF6584 family protein n=1 Tax=Kitasatospora sp. NPDC085879 TaxID=3154769 RepID=UPI003442C37D